MAFRIRDNHDMGRVRDANSSYLHFFCSFIFYFLVYFIFHLFFVSFHFVFLRLFLSFSVSGKLVYVCWVCHMAHGTTYTWGTFLLEFFRNVLWSDGKLGQARPMKLKFCRDFVGTNAGYWRWRPLWSRRLPRHETNMPRGGARETHRDRFCSSDAQTTDAIEGGPTPCWCRGESPL